MDFSPALESFKFSFSSGGTLPKENIPMTIMILSPHPDDESIIGSLPLRLMFENNAHVVNVAVTLGSDKKRQKARSKELAAACELLDLELLILNDDWKIKEKELKSLILKYQPQMILAPHLKDHHPTHIKTGQLLKKVLKTLTKVETIIAWTEFWGQNPEANVLVEVPVDVIELQMNALLCHTGEVARNPYHLRLPAWMMDNVRRGSETIGGKGASASEIAYGVLYEWELIRNGKTKKFHLPSSTLNRYADIGAIVQNLLD